MSSNFIQLIAMCLSFVAVLAWLTALLVIGYVDRWKDLPKGWVAIQLIASTLALAVMIWLMVGPVLAILAGA